MKTIKNTTKKPLSIPLPHGKRLFLGPGKTGQITSKAVDHPPLAALVEAGDVEVLGEGTGASDLGRGAGSSVAASQDPNRAKNVFRSGDG